MCGKFFPHTPDVNPYKVFVTKTKTKTKIFGTIGARSKRTETDPHGSTRGQLLHLTKTDKDKDKAKTKTNLFGTIGAISKSKKKDKPLEGHW